jgi:hypothetical protein
VTALSQQSARRLIEPFMPNSVRACLVPENAEFLKGLERHLVL